MDSQASTYAPQTDISMRKDSDRQKLTHVEPTLRQLAPEPELERGVELVEDGHIRKVALRKERLGDHAEAVPGRRERQLLSHKEGKEGRKSGEKQAHTESGQTRAW